VVVVVVVVLVVVVVVGRHLRQETCDRKSRLHIEIGVDITARDVFNLLTWTPAISALFTLFVSFSQMFVG
jgi:ABC-type microcin C transport system permease subunit YejE